MDLLEKFGLQVPALTVLVVLVIIFFRFLTKQGERMQAVVDDFRHTIEKTTGDFQESATQCHTVQREAVAALGRNSEVLTRFTEVQSEIQFALRELKKTE